MESIEEVLDTEVALMGAKGSSRLLLGRRAALMVSQVHVGMAVQNPVRQEAAQLRMVEGEVTVSEVLGLRDPVQ